MALTRISPVPASVHWDRRVDRPSEVSWGDQRLTVRSLASVRDERHAYRPDRGPRLTMVVEAERGQAVLVFDARTRRWFVEAVDLAA